MNITATVVVLWLLSAACFCGAWAIIRSAQKKAHMRRRIAERMDAVLSRHKTGGVVPTELPPVTDWFPHDVKPVHEGRYEVRRPTMLNPLGFADYRGGLWYAAGDDSPLALQIVEWRGLSERPA
ncbi:hypothetical protein KL1_00051 [Burkholderia phage vB_BceS_KL1]|uniref:Uncharacterized protein n=1 Tax=Burkholderia phage vB_BceS_KL1 TaxID=1132026 RepID=I6NQ26_9CAUD|nr:hypothetical protein B612_gp51 [Burkholderia phage vB_BceS_KL1]AEX56086.1 hypothetical protein KL1_00051 [Burkholderia phage vB_BceS_KL1]